MLTELTGDGVWDGLASVAIGVLLLVVAVALARANMSFLVGRAAPSSLEDAFRAELDALPEVVDAVAGRAEVILDGGIRRGSDVVKAVALGARACMVGRAFNYGVAAAGERGAALAIEILQQEIDRCLALIGRPTLADLDRSAVRLRHAVQPPDLES